MSDLPFWEIKKSKILFDTIFSEERKINFVYFWMFQLSMGKKFEAQFSLEDVSNKSPCSVFMSL